MDRLFISHLLLASKPHSFNLRPRDRKNWRIISSFIISFGNRFEIAKTLICYPEKSLNKLPLFG